jgi:hypothetical protein
MEASKPEHDRRCVMSLEKPAAPDTQAVTVEVQVRLLALAVPEPDGGYSVIVPALPGCVTEGDTIGKYRPMSSKQRRRGSWSGTNRARTRPFPW